MAEPAGEDRVLTIPNAFSLARLACAPIFLWLLFGRDNRLGAAFLLAGLGATDWVDGYLARRLGQVSALGKVLDPVADRLLLFVGVGGIVVDGSVPTWLAVLVLVRETLISAATVGLAGLGARRIDVQWVGKAGTFAFMVAFPLFLAGGSGVSWSGTARSVAWVFAIPGLLLAWYAAATYVPIARDALREGRGGRADVGADMTGTGTPEARRSE